MFRDNVPFLLLVPQKMARGVEHPVAVVRDDGLDRADFVAGEKHARVDDIGMLVCGGRQLCKCGALRCVVQAAIEINSDGL